MVEHPVILTSAERRPKVPRRLRNTMLESLTAAGVPFSMRGDVLIAAGPEGSVEFEFVDDSEITTTIDMADKQVKDPILMRDTSLWDQRDAGGVLSAIKSSVVPIRSDKPNFTPHVGMNRAQRRAAARKAPQGR